MALGEQVADHPGIVGERRFADGIQRDGSFHVPELAHVVLPAVDGGPAQQGIAHGLQCLLVFDHPLTLVGVPGRVAVDERREHGSPGLLELEEYDVVRARALQQRHVGPQPDAADTDDLVRDIDEGVSADRPPPVRSEGGQIVVEPGRDLVVLVPGHPGDQRRFLDDPPAAVMLLGEPG